MTNRALPVALVQEGAYDLVPETSHGTGQEIAWKVEEGDSFVPLDEYTGDVDGIDGKPDQRVMASAQLPLVKTAAPVTAKQESGALGRPVHVKHETKLGNSSTPRARPSVPESPTILYHANVVRVFTQILPSLQPEDTLQSIAQEAVSRLSKYCRNHFGPRAWLRPHGAWVQGSHMQSSELQIRIDFRTRKTPKDGSLEENENDPLKELDMKRSTMSKLATKFINNAQCPFKVVDAEQVQATSPLEYVVEYFAGSSSIRLYIGVGTDTGHGVQIDFVDRVIRRMLARTPQALHLIHLVRRWAEVSELESVSDGFLCPLGWTLLCLFYYVSIGEANPSSLYEAETSEQDDVSALPPMLSNKSGDASLGVLVDFFEMVAGFSTWLDDDMSQGTWGISLVSGTLVLGKDCRGSPFFIEDPGVKIATSGDFNVAEALTKDGWRCILSSCQGAANLLRDQSNPSAALTWLDALLFQCKQTLSSTENLQVGKEDVGNVQKQAEEPRQQGRDRGKKRGGKKNKRNWPEQKRLEGGKQHAHQQNWPEQEEAEGGKDHVHQRNWPEQEEVEDPRDELRPGNWFCPNCADVQDAHWWKCRRCGSAKPAGQNAAKPGEMLKRPRLLPPKKEGTQGEIAKRPRLLPPKIEGTQGEIVNRPRLLPPKIEGAGKSGKSSGKSSQSSAHLLSPKVEVSQPESGKGIVRKGIGKSKQWW